MSGDYISTSLPVWTSPRPGILEPLRLPSPPPPLTRFNTDPEVTCLFCEQVFHLPEDHQAMLQHLLTEHNFVIGDVNQIANFPAYIRYWRNKFRTNPPSRYCTSMRAPVKSEGGSSEEREFSFLSDVLPEDKELRRQLQMDRLEFVLRVQEEERRCENFQRGCLFCRQEYTSSSELIDHMAFDHNFNVGQPDNLVFVNEFLDAVEEKLESLVCLYCEKVFKSREVLKEHMRKKMHKKLNPKNKMWDRFYLVNYLESGKTWEDFCREDGDRPEDEVPSGWDQGQDHEGEEGEWGEWRDELGGAVCLFCPVTYHDTRELGEHMNIVHGFDFRQIKIDLKLNFYQQVKMINYIRRSVHLNTCIQCGDMFDDRDACLEHMTWTGHHVPGPSSDWDQPQYYFPTYENDNLLCGLEEDEDGERQSEDSSYLSDSGSSAFPPVQAEDLPAPVMTSILQDHAVRRSLIPSSRSKSRGRRQF